MKNNTRRECKWYQVCPMKRYSENGQIDRTYTDNYCHGNWLVCERYIKEEAGIYHPDNMLPDGTIDNSLG
ncbi:MAG: hypothetical protein JW874_05350 [Spirochaetales bacterium]|nr:hypothetical protein [Spirochaetales bacterium]